MMKKKFLIGIIIGAVSVGIYFWVSPPQVISVSPSDQDQAVNLNAPLIIKFNKPVKRQAISHLITPEVYGEWKFEDSIIKNHLFRALVFTPAIDFKPDTQYQVEVDDITSPIGIGFSNNFSFGFKTQTTLAPIKEVLPSIQSESKTTVLNISLDWQDHRLSCEAASLKMALAGKNVYVSEGDIMEKIGYDKTPHQGNIWGDPEKAFVGDIDGKMCDTGYGVHWETVAKAANNWRPAEAFSNWNLKNLTEEIQSGNPVVVWGTLPVATPHDYSWHTPEGKYIKTFRETHVRLAVGFIGDAANPSKIILNDPLSGQLYWSPSYFLTNWATFDNSGVSIR